MPRITAKMGGATLFALAVSGTMLAGSCAAPRALETPGLVVAPADTIPGVRLSGEPIIVGVRRITETQYRNAIASFLGDDIQINAKFEPEARSDGLLAVGASFASISANGFQQYYAAAESISGQALDEKRRARTLSCAPADATAPDDACAAEFVRKHGRLLFGRKLDDDEVSARVAIASAAAGKSSDFYAGLRLSLVNLLTSPDFLFRIERAQAVEGGDGLQLNPYSRAARISYLLWDAPPDEALLAAAESGALMSRAGLETQVSRMTASPRIEKGIRAFFSDTLQLDLFETLTKDASQYPKFSQAVADSAREQTLKVVVDHLAVDKGDYRDIFTTRDTFINRPLGAMYKVPFDSSAEWTPYTFDEASGHSGVLTQVAFLSLFSHPGRSSPTKRGAAVSEIFLCQTVPQPPANVDLSAINDTGKENAKTVRQRLELHRTEPLCSACHTLTDPPGLALEQFDGVGQRRTLENNARIDVSVDYLGKTVMGAQGLGQALRDNPRTPSCLVERVWAYGRGQAPDAAGRKQLEAITSAFADSGYRVPDLMAAMVKRDDFFAAARMVDK
ncbi:MAG: DUF1592 domain-containing protein [Alphaproteobacteria bacterium]|nr:DUF1592 domain-containing protein [Alphaproteobacteria bacterium]